MITGIPTPEDLRKAGLDYLCLAWVDLIRYIEQAEYYAAFEPPVLEEGEEDWTDGKNVADEHRRVAYRGLTTCGLLIHQGAEFLLKSRICAVSPYLLLDSPKGWATGSKAADFSEFYTLDAQLLARVHDTVCPSPLPEKFKQRLEKIRRRRNAVAHGLPRSTLSAEEMLRDLLEVVTELVGIASWPQIRRADARDIPAPWDDYYGAIPISMMREWDRVIKLLKPAECLRYLGINKKEQRFICLDCHGTKIRPEPPISLAVLRPNTRTSTTLYCLVCDDNVNVVRASCLYCKADVLNDEPEYFHCLSCDKDDGDAPP